MSEKSTDCRAQEAPSILEIFLNFFRIGITAYGGPAMMPHIREMVVNRKGWLTPQGFKLGLALCQAIPGATLMQLSAYTGFTQRGLPGALAGFAGFAVPATLLMTGLAALYHINRDLAATQSIMAGLSVVVLAIILLAVVDFARKYANEARQAIFSILAAAMFLGGIGPSYIILLAALAGLFVFKDGEHQAEPQNCLRTPLAAVAVLIGTAVAWLVFAFFYDRTLFDLCLSMAKVDVLAFGGYGAFPVMYHEVVDARAWMSAHTFMDGMALAQVTPGPILLASSFVGYNLRGLVGAIAGAVWIFTPSFFILMAAIPCCDRLLNWPSFRKALIGVLSTLGGLILAVGITLTRSVDWTWPKAIVGLVALVALWRKIDPLWVVLAGAGVGMFLF